MENQKTKIISIVAIVALLLVVVTATYAYFQAQTGEGSQTDIKINANTVDTFTFATGNPISFTLDQDNFASGKGNVTGSTFASAILTASNKTNTATEHYYVYLNIENNTFTYSINESTPEIIMTVTNSSGTEITDISGLTHTSVTDGKGTTISGYDITNKSGLITLFNNREIVATPTKEEKWNIKVTFVNYNANQNANTGKSMSAKVIIQKEKIVQTMANVCKSSQTLSSCVIAMDGIDETLYHHTSTLTNGAGDSSYRYAGANPDNYVCFGSTTSPCPTDSLYRIIGVFGNNIKLIKYDYANSNLLGTDGDYSTDTYSKSNISTYKGELTTINTYYWNYKNNTSINNGNGSNEWSTSLLNQTNLNQNFITNIGTEWANKIDMTTWKVGGYTNNNYNQPAKTAYQDEIVSPAPGGDSSETEYPAKIGLMYVSDYGFAAAPSAWTSDMSVYGSSKITSVNWMYMGLREWTISRFAGTAFYVNFVRNGGNPEYEYANVNYAVRPVFYLSSSVNYASGSGSATDPITIN